MLNFPSKARRLCLLLYSICIVFILHNILVPNYIHIWIFQTDFFVCFQEMHSLFTKMHVKGSRMHSKGSNQLHTCKSLLKKCISNSICPLCSRKMHTKSFNWPNSTVWKSYSKNACLGQYNACKNKYLIGLCSNFTHEFLEK